jgi:hypothetical protein
MNPLSILRRSFNPVVEILLNLHLLLAFTVVDRAPLFIPKTKLSMLSFALFAKKDWGHKIR